MITKLTQKQRDDMVNDIIIHHHDFDFKCDACDIRDRYAKRSDDGLTRMHCMLMKAYKK